jgi:phytoene dehydrogenase-like protein
MDDPVIVVGGGICGLICAATLAREGQRVELLEAGAELGGRARTGEQDGYLLNRGAHALYPSAERLLRGAGVRVSGGHPNAARTKLLYRGEPFALTPALAAGRGPLSFAERRRIGAALARLTVGGPPRSQAIDAAGWAAAEGRTELAAATLGGLLRLSTYAGELALLGTSLGRAMLGEASRRPVRYLDGGWRSIVEGLAARTVEAGGVIHRASRVLALAEDARGITVGLSGGEERRAARVVLAGLSPAAAGRLLDGAGGSLPDTVDEPRTIRAACLDVALSRLPEPGTPLLIGADEPLYLSVHTAYARLAPGSGAVVQLLRYDDGAAPAGAAVHERLRELLDLAQPGWREQVLHERFAPRMLVAHHLPAPGEGLQARPGPRDTGLPGVLIAGDWVGPVGWLAGASLASGVAAARAVIAALPTRTSGAAEPVGVR